MRPHDDYVFLGHAFPGRMRIHLSNVQPAVKLFSAKSILSATGSVNRLYPSVTPVRMFNLPGCPANTGLGMTAAYRTGASIVNIEMAGASAGPKYFSRAGKGTWIGVLRNPDGSSVGPFVKQPTKELGDITSDIWPTVFNEKLHDGSDMDQKFAVVKKEQGTLVAHLRNSY